MRLTLYTRDSCSRLLAFLCPCLRQGHHSLLCTWQSSSFCKTQIRGRRLQKPLQTPLRLSQCSSLLGSVHVWVPSGTVAHGWGCATCTRMCVQRCPCPQSASPDGPTGWGGRRLWEDGCSLAPDDRLGRLPVPGPRAVRPTAWTRRPLHMCAGFTEQTGLRKKKKKKENKES